MAAVNFFVEDIEFKTPHPRKIVSWIKAAAEKEEHVIIEINYIFCSDKYLSKINKTYLRHNTLTDIVTFDNSETKGALEADIFISVERVQANALKYRVPFANELLRVMIHGFLHLLGFKDKNPDDKDVMRKKEDAYLSLFRK
jgi:probable rRNA maturation factor